MFNRQSIHIAFLLWGGIFCLIAALCMYISRNFEKEKRRWLLLIQLTCAVLLFSDAAAWGYRGSSGAEAHMLVRLSNFLVFLLSDCMLFFFHGYACCRLFPDNQKRLHLVPVGISNCARGTTSGTKSSRSEPDRRIRIIFMIALLGAGMVLLSQLNHFYYYIDAQNYYHRNTGYIFSVLIPLIGIILEFSLIIQYRKRIAGIIAVSMILYLVLPFSASFIILFHYGVSWVNIAICVSVILMFIASMIEQNQALALKEKEIADMRIAVMNSQIQPHFIYNSLNTIYHLCDMDVQLAKEAISDFSEYLQYIRQSLTRTTLVSFNEELQTVKTYLQLEKLRFGDDLNIIYQIKVSNFSLPALSIQPLVENAVKHGICQCEDGGTLTLATQETETAVEIIISDDGVGFDPAQSPGDGKPHVGIQNVKQRLYHMCQGTLNINSQAGIGTTVTIHLPKERK